MNDIDDMIGQIDDVVTLERMLGKRIIRTMYFVGAVLYTIGAISVLVWSINEKAPWIVILAIIFYGIIGNVVWRLSCELWILLYYMHEKLTSIDKALNRK